MMPRAAGRALDKGVVLDTGASIPVGDADMQREASAGPRSRRRDRVGLSRLMADRAVGILVIGRSPAY